MKKWQITGFLAVLIIGFLLVSGCTQDNTKYCADNFPGTYYDPSSKMCEPFSTPTQTPTPTMSIEQIKNNAIKITYDDLFRNNENYIGKTVVFRGKISQVFPPSDDYYDLILDTSPDSQIESRIYISNYKGSRFLEGDTVNVWGTVDGLVTLKSVLGEESSIPELNALQIDLIKKVSQTAQGYHQHPLAKDVINSV
jgi:hypothetical protein